MEYTAASALATGHALLTGGPSAIRCAITPADKSSLPRMKYSIRPAEVSIAGRAESLAKFKSPGVICDGRNAH